MTTPSSLGRPIKAIVDKQAFVNNIERAEELASGASAVVVIKADAYGHGLVEMAKAAGRRDLAVASADEANELISAGVSNRIWVLEGPFSEQCLSLNLHHDLLWVIHSDWQIKLIESAEPNFGKISIWLKLDTGMHRLGFTADQLEQSLPLIKESTKIVPFGCMVHFASSDEPDNDSVRSQISDFDLILKDNGLSDLPVSLSNSGAIMNYPEAHRNWVRPGIMIYGGMPNPQDDAESVGLKAVMEFRSEIMSIRTIEAGESVGYGARWTASKKSKIAIVACGYGDGYPRHAPNGTPVWVSGQRVPLVGTVSMDMIAVDVSDVDSIEIGDAVELWGRRLPVDEVALACGTISYELLTRVTKRVPRVYR